jgi:hypothetical protein
MQGTIDRHLTGTVKKRLQNNPAVAILGPRQCGKTTLAGQIVKKFNPSVYLDLENPADLAKLSDPLAFFSLHNEDLVCLDEIQRAPELFSILRSIIDERARNAQFLILGSAGLCAFMQPWAPLQCMLTRNLVNYRIGVLTT